MIEVLYERDIPYPQSIVLSQYFDLEHLEHVHPRTFGRARMLSAYPGGIVWELEWPPVLGCRLLRSTFRQDFHPPWGVHAVVTRGFLRGSETFVELGKWEKGTHVRESHRLAIPNWKYLRDLVRRATLRRLDLIWDEDLAVQVCRGGWPGVPPVARPANC